MIDLPLPKVLNMLARLLGRSKVLSVRSCTLARPSKKYGNNPRTWESLSSTYLYEFSPPDSIVTSPCPCNVTPTLGKTCLGLGVCPVAVFARWCGGLLTSLVLLRGRICSKQPFIVAPVLVPSRKGGVCIMCILGR